MKLVLDWDGTITVRDTLWMLLEEFGDRDVLERAEAELLRGEISYRDLMELEMGTVRAPIAEVADWLGEHARLLRRPLPRRLEHGRLGLRADQRCDVRPAPLASPSVAASAGAAPSCAFSYHE